MKKCYHMTSLDRVRSISVSGLTPQNGDNSKTVNDTKVKVFFSEGMTGAVALYADLQKHYDDIKAGNVGKTPQDRVEAVNATNSLEEYLGGDGVYFLFDGTDLENEKNFMDGCTDQSIAPENLQVCLLKNNETNTVSYSRYDIIKYMMSKVPAESIYYTGKDVNPEDVETATTQIRTNVNWFYENNKSAINAFRAGNYTLENIPLREFCEKYLNQDELVVTGQNIGKYTMNLLEDIEAVRNMEMLLDRDVRNLELEHDMAKEPDKIREKKDDNNNQ